MRLLAAVCLVAIFATPAYAHSDAEWEAWERSWYARAQVAITPKLIAERYDMTIRHWTAPVVEISPGINDRALTEADAGFWESLIIIHFAEADRPWARRVLRCESRGDPDATNPSSGAAGLFQFLPSTWEWASEHAGWAGSSPYNPQANVAVAADLYYWLGPSQWSCK